MGFIDGQWPQLLDFLVNSKEVLWLPVGAVFALIWRKRWQTCCIHGHHETAVVWQPLARAVALSVVASLFVVIAAFPLLTYPGLLNKIMLLSAGTGGIVYFWRAFQPLTEWDPDKCQGLAVMLFMWAISFGGFGLAGLWHH